MIFIPQGIGQKRFPAEQRMLLNTPDRERGVREEGAAVGEEKKRGRRLRGARGDQACSAHEGSDGEREYQSL